jgi:hypothetical protein
MVILGRWAVSYERGSPEPVQRCLCRVSKTEASVWDGEDRVGGMDRRGIFTNASLLSVSM